MRNIEGQVGGMDIPGFLDFEGCCAQAIDVGCAVYSTAEDNLAKKIPLHLFCTAFDSSELHGKAGEAFGAGYKSFARKNFFGASLFCGQLILYGPDSPCDRVPSVRTWRPISWKFANCIAEAPKGGRVKIGVVNGYERQYDLWVVDGDELLINHNSGAHIGYFPTSALEDLIEGFRSEVYLVYEVDAGFAYDEAVYKFLNDFSNRA